MNKNKRLFNPVLPEESRSLNGILASINIEKGLEFNLCLCLMVISEVIILNKYNSAQLCWEAQPDNHPVGVFMKCTHPNL